MWMIAREKTNNSVCEKKDKRNDEKVRRQLIWLEQEVGLSTSCSKKSKKLPQNIQKGAQKLLKNPQSCSKVAEQSQSFSKVAIKNIYLYLYSQFEGPIWLRIIHKPNNIFVWWLCGYKRGMMI